MAHFINIVSYNMRGFQQGKPQLLELCEVNDIIAVQEHWLADCDLNKLVNLHDDFLTFARSAMTEKLQTGFLRGRPFGGVALFVRKNLVSNVRILGIDDKCRCFVLMLTLHSGYRLLVTDVYWPCFESGQEYQSAVLDCIGFIESCITCNDHDGVILLGDFNFECDNRCIGYKLLQNLLHDYGLMSCEKRAEHAIEYTYFQDKLGRYSVIDHMFVSRSLYCNIIWYAVIESGINLSDHMPIKCVIAFQTGIKYNGSLCDNDRKTNSKKACNILRWDKGDINMYYYHTGLHLQSLSVPYDLLTCECEGLMCPHQAVINNFYNDIINALKAAAECTIPTVCSDSSKAYWNSELQQLKEDSIQAHLGWVAMGKPRQGWMNSFRLQCKYKYKIAIRNAALAFEWDLDDELSQLYLRKDMDSFWKKWQNRFSKRNIVPPHIDGNTEPQDIVECFKESFSAACFNSYADKASVAELQAKLSEVDAAHVTENVFLCQRY